jgi:MATE family multidrug resistance protein
MTLVVMHAANAFLDYSLIFGKFGFPEMGVEGAGIATTIAMGVGTLFYLGLALRQARGGGFLRAAGLRAVLPTIVRLSAPAGLQNLLFSAGFVVFFVLAGKVGTATLAASNVLINLSLVCVLPGLGLGLAGASLVGQAMGAGDLVDARRWGWEVVRLGAVVMGLLGLALALGARTWLGIFIVDSPETLELAVLPLVILGLGQFLDGIGVVLINVLVGIGDTMAALRISVFCQWVLFLPLAWVFAVYLDYGMIALWVGMVGYRLLTAALATLRFHRGAWTQARA